MPNISWPTVIAALLIMVFVFPFVQSLLNRA